MKKVLLDLGISIVVVVGLWQAGVGAKVGWSNLQVAIDQYQEQKASGIPTEEEIQNRRDQWFDEDGNIKEFLVWDPTIDPYVFKNSKLDSIRLTEQHRKIMQAGDPDSW